MNSFIVLALCAAVALATLSDSSLDDEWESYKASHRKVYAGQEEAARRLIWEQNVRRIEKHNLGADMGMHTYWLGVNQYTDMSNEEFRRVMSGYRYNDAIVAGNEETTTFLAPDNVKPPDTVDWRTQGYVTPVKDQGLCGSSWAFSSTGSLEGQHFKKTGTLVSLSEQNLLDCSRSFGNMGCEGGGTMDQCFSYIKANKGVDTEASYPYTARDGICKFNASNVGATVTGFVDLPSMNETALQIAVATIGPISVAVDSSGFQQYSHGVYDDPDCSQTQVIDGVLVVGYGTYNNLPYWLVKSNWGTKWGMQGYIMMSRNKNNQCGIATLASYPTV